MSKESHRLEIVFREEKAVYAAGDIVSGFLHLHLKQELRVKGICLHTTGVARVQWDEKRSYTKGSAARLSHGHSELFLDEVFVVINKGETLSAGRHSWPFVVRLPPSLPSSFDGQWGRVQYTARASVERAWKGNIESTKNFVVLGLLDLNEDPDAKNPAENVVEAVVGSGCCLSGPITGHLMVRRKGFSVGQTLPFTSNVDNRSNRSFNVRIALSQQTTFRADRQVRRTNSVKRVLTKGVIKGRQKMTWEDEVMAIPPSVPPTRLGGGCKTIEVKYLLTLILSPIGPGKDVEIPIEIIIGTTPIRNALETSGRRHHHRQQHHHHHPQYSKPGQAV